jgi:hypothetical protein
MEPTVKLHPTFKADQQVIHIYEGTAHKIVKILPSGNLIVTGLAGMVPPSAFKPAPASPPSSSSLP